MLIAIRKQYHTVLISILHFWLAGAALLPAQTTVFIRADTFNSTLDLTPSLKWYPDESAKLTFTDISQRPFQAYDPANDTLQSRVAYWFCGQIQNTSTSDTLLAFVHISGWFDWLEAWFVRGGATEHFRNGDFCNLYDRAFPANWETFPLRLAPGEQTTFFLRARNYFAAPHRSPVFTLKTAETMTAEMRLHPAQTYPTFLFGALFLAILLFLTVVAGLLTLIIRHAAFGWYALFSLASCCFYLRSFEKNLHITMLFSYWQRHYIGIEVVLGYGCFFTYLMFIRAFLDTAALSPRFDRMLLWSARAILGVSILNLAIWAVWGEEACFPLYNVVRAGFLGIAFLLLYPALFRMSGPLPRFVGMGTLCILIPVIFTLAGDIVDAQVIQLAGGAAREMIFPDDVRIYMFNTRVGFLLEMFCFAAGLAWKYRLEHEGRLSALQESDENRRKLEKARQILKDYLLQAAGAAQSEPALARQIRDLVEKHLDDYRLNVEKLAQLMGRSRAALYRNLSKDTGKTPHQFIRDIRLEHACRLLLSTPSGVAEIAYQTGFNDPSYFSKIFAEQFGVPPTAFRLQNSEPE